MAAAVRRRRLLLIDAEPFAVSYYLPLKHLHITLAVISISLLLLRFFLLQWRGGVPKLLKILPHLVDTLLMVAGISLALMLQFKPLEQPWLWQKLLLLLFYIGAGMLALKAARGGLRYLALAAAVLLFSLMALLARSKLPLPELLWG